MRTLLSIIAVLSCVGCSTTPGDAAYRGGQPAQAAELYKKGADQGDASAALKLGTMLQQPTAEIAGYGSAGSWFLKACELGSASGCHNAGVGYEYGQLGFDKSLEKARELYGKAAEMGYMQSAYNLGSLYANRYFLNDVEGLKWLLFSQAKARECSRQELCKWILQDPPGHIGNLKARMTVEQIQQAEEATAKRL